MGEPNQVPTNTPTPVSIKSFPFVTTIPEGYRIVFVVAGGSDSLIPTRTNPCLPCSPMTRGVGLNFVLSRGSCNSINTRHTASQKRGL